MTNAPGLLRQINAIDQVLEAHAAQLGGDHTAYRNHAYRVANLCAAREAVEARSLDADSLGKTAIAAAFHDLGIWTDGTFDYLEPSVRLAREHLTRSGRSAWVPEISDMIREHHKITRVRETTCPLVESFRRADWIDVSKGLLSFGLPRRLLGDVFAAWPAAGFHRRLVQLSLGRLRTHPLSPLPMVRL